MTDNIDKAIIYKSQDPDIKVVLKRRAELQFYRYVPLVKIAEDINASLATVVKWSRDWKAKREEVTDSVVESMRENSKAEITNILQTGLPMVAASLKHLAERVDKKTNKWKPLSIGETKAVTEICTSVDKLLRLDTGLPTEISTIQPANIQGLIDAVNKDKFMPEEVRSEIITQGEIVRREEDRPAPSEGSSGEEDGSGGEEKSDPLGGRDGDV